MSIRVDLELLPHASGLPLPEYQTPDSSGMDVLAAITAEIVISPGRHALIPTGLRVAVPAGHELQVRSRSGLALKHGVVVLNSPGTIDSDYRGEIQVILINLGPENFTVTRGMRIAQLVLSRVERVDWQPVQALSTTDRGAGGFGHTGI